MCVCVRACVLEHVHVLCVCVFTVICTIKCLWSPFMAKTPVIHACFTACSSVRSDPCVMPAPPSVQEHKKVLTLYLVRHTQPAHCLSAHCMTGRGDEGSKLVSLLRPVNPYGYVRCVRVEVDVLGSPFLIVLMVSMDVKQH